MYDPSIELKGYKSSEDNFKHTAVFLSHMHLDHSKIINYLSLDQLVDQQLHHHW